MISEVLMLVIVWILYSVAFHRSNSVFFTRMGEKRNACKLLVRNPERKRPLGRPKLRWVDNIKMDLGEMRWDGMDWFGLVQDRNKWRVLANEVMNLRLP
jgi:hypothetical protein